jgi:hypothetical protein
MLSTREAVFALYGAWRLARLDGAAMRFFVTTLDGFWNSFYAALFVAPFYVVLLAVEYSSGMVRVGVPRFALVEAIAYVISWVAFPLVMVGISRLLDREARYLGFIVAYNWAAVLQNAFFLPLVMLAIAGALPDGLADGLVLVAHAAIMLYIWFITRTALAVASMAAVGIVVLDLVLAYVIRSFATVLERVPG